jgi:perosamine synthetase
MNKKVNIPQIEPTYGVAERRAIDKYLKTNAWLTEFEQTEAFEKAIGDAVGAQYVSVVSSGTVALFLALKALNIGVGDEVIVPDLTMIASPNAVVLAGATPVFADVDAESLCLDPKFVEKAITSKTKAVMQVSLNGRAGNLSEIKKICSEKGIHLIEDAAQAFGSVYQKKALGTHGTIGIYSFTPHKIITTGQGGAIISSTKEIYEAVEKLKDFGRMQGGGDNHDEIGWNFKFPDLLAVFGVVQIKSLKKRIAKKKDLYRLYSKLLADIPQVKMLKNDLSETVPWFIDIYVDDPIALRKYLKERGIGSRPSYPAIHTQPIYKHVKGVFPNSMWAGTRGLWLPSSHSLTTADVKRVCMEIRNYYLNN